MKKPNFEISLKELEEIVEQLEKGDTSLDETLAKYEKGIKIYKQCYQILGKAEKKINILLKDATGENHVEEFDLDKTRNGELPPLENDE